ncbi:hypothetical protein QPL79_08065 [Ignisphaera sp. 4213-co]|uniref:Uncharacterized protein n=1 Tax=Ignisphaera cupida TaxID=3050454 RepID=A0ABD4Z7Y6_9CREN|nr:hypothetical protein [Ignisphaera sp. 4213-co]MDK6029315.1 hypothetical protein [Ignisphaera sp. 4213-co]
MMCCIASEKIENDKLEKLLDFTVLETRRNKGKYFTLIFIASSTKNAFRYRDVFTKYLDIGIRIYVENENSTQLNKILSMCEKILYSKEDDVQRILSIIALNNKAVLQV